jgi:cell pole-organizing protein PopZ
MEEILASIRKIISEDEGEDQKMAGRDPAPAEPDDAPETSAEQPDATATEPDDEVLDLTQMIGDDGTVVDLDSDEARRSSTELAVELAEDYDTDKRGDDARGSDGRVEAFGHDDQATLPSNAAGRGDEGALVSPATAAAASAALSELATAIEHKGGSGIGTPLTGGRSLEDLVREALAPHLKVWLDENLASMVERLVREEIGKMVRRAEDR